MKSQKRDVEAGDGKAPESLPLNDFKPRKSIKYGFTGDEESLFFRDGRRRIDFVLVYETGTKTKALEYKRAEKRVNLERAMKKEGIDIETSVQGIPGEGPEAQLCYAKLHAKWDLLIRYADIMKLRMPLKKEVEEEAYPEDEISRYCPPFFRVDKSVLPPSPHFVSTGFSKSKMALFNILDRDSFFSPSQRIRIIWECMSRIQFVESNPSGVGIQKLLADDTYLAGFPLHDGPYEAPKGETKKPTNLRAALYDQWGQFSKFYKFQPIEHIKNYFGGKMGFYFAWMEFYTIMLIPAVIVGAVCLLYGMITMKNDIPVQEVCTHPDVKDTIMCPICDRRCPYWRLEDSCMQSKSTYLIDNPATIFFATFMALWSAVFLILWKRKQTILSWNFDTYYATEQEEQVRPELEAQIKPDHWKVNPITQMKEPYVSPWRRILQAMLSGTVVFFMVLLVLAATFGTIVYRTMVNVAIYASSQSADAESAQLNDDEEKFAVKYSTYIVGFTAALLNLIVILILNSIYYRIAKWLTEKEYLRTQSEYEDSLTIKYYIFEFVNTYCSVFYVAFFKGR
ncbi:hypothetical protein RvY_01825-2 [Ramazzottius varieornatus]|nr:hypothetical protein RvY_01825-2 [Ramazzottius varieornatus]